MVPRSRGLLGGMGGASMTAFLTPRDIMRRLSVSRTWVQDHRDELGGRKIAGLLRFPADRVEAFIAGEAANVVELKPRPKTPARQHPAVGMSWNRAPARAARTEGLG